MTIIALLVFAAAALFLLDVLWLRRGRLGAVRAAALAVAGLFLLLGAAWAIMPALWDTSAERLRADLAERETRVTTLSGEKSALTRELIDLRNQLKHEADREARDLSALSADAAHVRDILTTGPQAFQIAPAVSTSSTPKDRLRAEILNFASLKAVPPPQPAERVVIAPAQPSALDTLKTQMAAKMTTPNYDIEAYPDRELIRGRAGRYYVVDLKNASNGVRFFFEGGKYTLARSTPEFRSALNAFIAEVLQKFEGKVDYGMFVRGSADQKPYSGAFEPGAEFRRIRYLRALGGDKYGADAERIFDSRVRNDDLPDLRAAFMQKIVSDVYPTKPPVILEGAVTPKTDTRDRNVELILYVNW